MTMHMDIEKAVGLDDMHPTQLANLIQYVGYVLDLASTFDDRETFNEALERTTDLMHLFGGDVLTAAQRLPE